MTYISSENFQPIFSTDDLKKSVHSLIVKILDTYICYDFVLKFFESFSFKVSFLFQFKLCWSLVKMRFLIFQMFCNVVSAPKSCKLNIFFLFLSFLSFSYTYFKCKSKCCKCFKELNLFMKRRQDFLRNTQAHIQDIYLLQMYYFLSIQFFTNKYCPSIPIWWFVFEL